MTVEINPKIKNFFSKFQLNTVNLSAPFMDAEIKFIEADAEAAWALYIELITRISIKPLSEETGVEFAALESIYSIFPTTREILKEYGRKGQSFSKIAIIVLNQVLRPFTAKWHRLSENRSFKDEETTNQFRKELADLQKELRKFAAMLAEIAGIDDISDCL